MKKIMFNDRYGLTDAVLQRHKTQTRRIIPQSIIRKVAQFQSDYFNATFDKLTGVDLYNQYFFIEKIGKLPYNVGEIVAIAQSYKTLGNYHVPRADAGWNNKMFVKAVLMPNRIKITGVRIEQLQSISYDDCLSEGIAMWSNDNYVSVKFDLDDEYRLFDYDKMPATPQIAYATLIDKISGNGTWDRNPYVFVYTFEVLK